MAGLIAIALLLPSIVAAVSPSSGSTPFALADSSSIRNTPSFAENAGQIANEDVRFTLSAGGTTAGFLPGGVLFALGAGASAGSGGSVVRLDFDGSSRVPPSGRVELPHRSNYFLGADSERWRVGVRSYRELHYTALYDGVDLVFFAEPDGLKYEFDLRAGIPVEKIQIRVSGATAFRIGGFGALVVSTPSGEIRDAPPLGDQDGWAVPCAFEMRGDDVVGFACPTRDPTRSFRIDPLVYATVLGGAGTDEGRAVALDSQGNAYVTGLTASPDFPSTQGVVLGGATDVFVAKVAANGSLLYSTFLGGSYTEEGYAIAVDASGNAYVSGYTLSADFPTTPGAVHRTFEGGDAFAAKIGPAGDALLYSTLLGGANFDEALSLAVAPDGGVVLAGETLSSDFPATAGAFDRVPNGGWDAFVSKLDPTGSRLAFSTLLGGQFFDAAHGVALDPDGFVYVVGYTSSTDFPVTAGAFQELLAGGFDGFVVKLDPSGSGLVYGTLLGGAGADDARALALGPGGTVFVVGETFSSHFPTTPGAFDTTVHGFSDVFLVAVAPGGDALTFGTLLGGSGFDEARSLARGPSGSLYIAGSTTSLDFPGTDRGPDARTLRGAEDAFLAVVQGGSLAYAAFVGGRAFDETRGLAVDASGVAYLAGTTESEDFPSTAGGRPPAGGGRNAFLVAVLPAGGTDSLVVLLWIAAVLAVAVAVSLVVILILVRRKRRGGSVPSRPAEPVPAERR